MLTYFFPFLSRKWTRYSIIQCQQIMHCERLLWAIVSEYDRLVVNQTFQCFMTRMLTLSTWIISSKHRCVSQLNSSPHFDWNLPDFILSFSRLILLPKQTIINKMRSSYFWKKKNLYLLKGSLWDWIHDKRSKNSCGQLCTHCEVAIKLMNGFEIKRFENYQFNSNSMVHRNINTWTIKNIIAYRMAKTCWKCFVELKRARCFFLFYHWYCMLHQLTEQLNRIE